MPAKLSQIFKARSDVRRTRTVFLDEYGRLIDDPKHSSEEERFVLLGYSFQVRCLIVSHCYREPGPVIRLISARKATANEEKVYWSLR